MCRVLHLTATPLTEGIWERNMFDSIHFCWERISVGMPDEVTYFARDIERPNLLLEIFMSTSV